MHQQRTAGDPGRGRGYLQHTDSGVPWMLDPDDPVLVSHAGRQAAGPDSPASYSEHVSDVPALKQLLRERHVALVLDPARADAVDAVIDRWAQDLVLRKPDTLAGCASTLGQELGVVLGDAHLRVRHGRHHQPEKQAVANSAGPAWESSTLGRIRVVRIRTLDGSNGADRILRSASAEHDADFSYGSIVVDLRGNGGGDDSYVSAWLAPHAPADWTLPCEERTMALASTRFSLAYWNYAVWLRLNHHAVPEAFDQDRVKPQRQDHVIIRTGTPAPDPLSGSRPWTGRMVVLIDGGTGSSAESAALMLKSAFNAALAGTPSYGAIDYGNSTPYYLPASGMEIHLPSQANNWGRPVDFIGIQPDVVIPAGTGIEDVAAQFDRFHPAAAS